MSSSTAEINSEVREDGSVLLSVESEGISVVCSVGPDAEPPEVEDASRDLYRELRHAWEGRR